MIAEAQDIFSFSSSLSEGAQTAAPASEPSTEIIHSDAYTEAVAPAVHGFASASGAVSAINLSRAIVHAAFEHAGVGVGIVLNCSWGKDSSAMVGIVTEVMMERAAAGKSLVPVILAVAHTGNEFPEVEARIVEQNAKLNRWAEKNGFDLTVVVAAPPAKDTLFALLAGAGYALPSYSSGGKATSANWCVDRLKKQPIALAVQLAKGKSHRFLQFLGVRSDESSKRAGTIERYSEGLPFGLSRMSDDNGRGFDGDRLAVQPIAHWSHETLRTYLRQSMAEWDPMSYESLKVVYRKGADDSDLESASECSIVRTAEGGMSNVCSDLSGTRFGCLTCVRSKNRSLINHARRDRRYVWINALHKFVYAGIAQHKRRMADMKEHGFDNIQMFAKGYTFKWRYTLLMFIYRAEMESGFKLLTRECEDAIRAHWERSGILTVLPAHAKEDAIRWRATSKIRRSYEADAENYQSLSLSLPDGLPAGVYAHLRNPDHFSNRSALAVANMLVFAGKGGSFYPQMKAYVFWDHSRGGNLTMISDVPSDMGKKLNTDALSGYEGFALELLTVRDSTPWERSLQRGRIIFYRHQQNELSSMISRIQGFRHEVGVRPTHRAAAALHDVLLANHEYRSPCGEKEFINHLDEGHFICGLKGRLTYSDLKMLHACVENLTELSEHLSSVHEEFIRFFRRDFARSDLRSADKGGDDEARGAVGKLVKATFDLRAALPVFERYVAGLQDLNSWVRSKQANTELINRLAYIVRTSWYDDHHALELLAELLRSLDLRPGQGPTETVEAA